VTSARSLLVISLLALLPAAALAVTQSEPSHRDVPQGSPAPRPERIVPTPQPEIVPDHARPRQEKRAGIDQLPVGSERVRITVRVIAAQPGQGASDPRLQSFEPLGTLPLRYNSYKLVDERSFDLDWKAGAEMPLPGSRSVLITPSDQLPDGRIRVHVDMLSERERKVHSVYSVARGGTLFVGGYRLDPSRPDAGVLLVAITQIVR
jgi:hypothetical protein